MKYTQLGSSDLTVSRICMGCMGFGDAHHGQHTWTIDEEHSREIMKRGLELGVNFFDTAIGYQSGTSEQYLGRALRDFARRDEVVVATKFLPRTNQEIEAGVSGQEHIRRLLEKSLQNLGMDHVDLYIYHMWDYDRTMRSFEKTLENLGTDYLDLYLIHMPYGDYHGSWRTMEELLWAGKVKAIGVCNFLPDRLCDLILSHEVIPAVNQIELHPFCQQRKLRQIMAQYQIRPMAWAPFAEGMNGIFRHPVLSAIGAQYSDTFFPLNANDRTAINEAVLSAYQQELEQSEAEGLDESEDASEGMAPQM